ncbi:DUF4124 domain-containing protein [Halopseudomonas oceani]|uniref:DUF4124 domain-containing protein n=1 Tax=Halopseudomonas oceani TaxID=1708783 RepID=UPI002AA892A5|nr:DUF4124 domain-containing protein [Halopseudomonas oceani]
MAARMACVVVGLAALALHAPGYAQVYRCVGADGSTVFSQQACPDGSGGDPVDARNDPPSGNSDYIPWGDVGVLPERSSSGGSRINVVGAGYQCSDLSDREIRTAIVQERALIGMNTEQLRKALGAPLRINGGSHGNDQWVYPGRLYIYVDKLGCVVSWN